MSKQSYFSQTSQLSITIVFVYTQLNVKTILFQTIQFSVSTASMSKTVPFQTRIVLFRAVQFSTSTQFSSIWPIDRTLSSATTAGQSGPGSDGNEEVLRIPQSEHYWNLTIRLFSVIYRTFMRGVLPPVEVQSVYSTAPADWARERLKVTEREKKERERGEKDGVRERERWTEKQTDTAVVGE